MTIVRCGISQCSFNKEGDCLNRVIRINENGVCKYLTKDGWMNPVEDQYKVKLEVIESDLCGSEKGNQ